VGDRFHFAFVRCDHANHRGNNVRERWMFGSDKCHCVVFVQVREKTTLQTAYIAADINSATIAN
jgi:hypothetical protein